jgi:hypothetical protein
MAQYSPAPWTWTDDRTALYSSNSETVISDYDGVFELLDGSDVVQNANARLIEAAPELFELLKFMLDQYVPAAADIVFGEDWVKEAKFTIAKVLGESA